MKLVLDFDNWTMGDIERLEEAADMAFQDVLGILQTGAVRMRLAVALVYASEARTDPTFTVEQARAVRLTDLEVSTKGPEAPAPLVPPPGA